MEQLNYLKLLEIYNCLYIYYTYVVRALLSMRRLVMFTHMIHKCVYITQLYFN